MEIGEVIAIKSLAKELDEKCPFKENVTSPISEEDPENLLNDWRNSVQEEQDNSGGTLGRNLKSGSVGRGKTVGGPYPPRTRKEDRIDTRRTKNKLKLKVSASVKDGIPDGVFPFTLAAHHTIPGDESLAPSSLHKFMVPGSATADDGQSWEITDHIGYNVNGCHNGVWLPGNYAIRASSSPVQGMSWGAKKKQGGQPAQPGLSDTKQDWCIKYVAAAVKQAGMFHDRHFEYSSHVKKLLNKISFVLFSHLKKKNPSCPDCGDSSKIPPPYLIKKRLYRLSRYFRWRLKGRLTRMKRPWVTTDKWVDEIFSNGRLSESFQKEMRAASVEDRR